MFDNPRVTWNKIKFVVERYTINLIAIAIIMTVFIILLEVVSWFFPILSERVTSSW